MMKKLFLLLLFFAVAGGCGLGLHLRHQRSLRIAEEERKCTQTAYEQVCAFHQANPNIQDEVIRRYQAFVTQYPDSEQALLIRAQIEQLRLEQERQAQQTAEEAFKCAIEQMIANGQLDEAAAYAEQYDGPFASALKEMRDSYTQRIRRQIKSRDDAAAQSARNAQTALDELMKQTANALFLFQFDAADALLKDAASDPVLVPEQSALLAFIAEAEPLCTMPRQICLSFLENMDSPVTVLLKNGEKILRINDVNNTTVIADRILYVDNKEVGSTPNNFTFNDLSLREIAARIGKEKTDENILWMALLFVQIKQYNKALKALDATTSPLIPLLRELVETEASSNAAPFHKAVTSPVFEPDEHNKLIRL